MTLPTSMQRSMAAEAEADREARAKVRGSTHSESKSRSYLEFGCMGPAFHGSDFHLLSSLRFALFTYCVLTLNKMLLTIVMGCIS